jgi:hypothetical protein
LSEKAAYKVVGDDVEFFGEVKIVKLIDTAGRQAETDASVLTENVSDDAAPARGQSGANDPKATSAIARATTAHSSRACRALAGTIRLRVELRRRLLNLALLEALECGSLVPRWKQTIRGTATWTHRGGTCFSRPCWQHCLRW